MTARSAVGILKRLPALVVVLAALLPYGPQAAAQQPEPLTVEAVLDRDQVTVGDRIVLTLTVRTAAAVQVDTPSIPALPADLEMLEVLPPQEEVQPDGQRLLVWRYVLAAFAPGQVQVPPISIGYRAGGSSSVVSSRPIAITVESVIPPGAVVEDIRDLKGQLDIPGAPLLPWRPLTTAAAVALAALALAAGVRSFQHRRRLWRLAPPPSAPSLSPEETARAELDRLRASPLLEQGEYTTLYGLLGRCIRRYLQDRYDFPATALTTPELEATMVARGMDRWQARLVAGLLAECDAVTYARYLPAPARLEGDLRLAYEIVGLATASPAPS